MKITRITGILIAAAVAFSMAGAVLADETDIATETDVATGEECYEVITPEEDVYVSVDFDEDYLAEQFIMQEMSVTPQPLLRSYNYGAQLTQYNSVVFSNMLPHIIAIANGSESSTVIEASAGTFTAAELGLSDLRDRDAVERAVVSLVGFQGSAIMDALMNACPFEMYWYDKTVGSGVSRRMITRDDQVEVRYIFELEVSDDYQGSGTFTVDTARYGQALRAACENARAIITRHTAERNYEKLVSYRNEICSLVTYNYQAADDSTNTPYGNPWQIIWVFDGNPDTNVVCEGYAKAFQYLCDNSVFSGEVYAISVTGDFYSRVSGGHMWNIVHMDDGNNYMVDVTNSESQNDLFLSGWVESGENTGLYKVNGHYYYYMYDSDTVNFYSPADLRVSAYDYVPPSSGEDEPVYQVEMYRLYNPYSGEHFYTSNSAERDALRELGWNYEGIGWTAPSYSNTPVYRLYNRYAGEHHYTTNVAERDQLVAVGWDYENIGWYSDDAQGVPLYRQYNPNAFANNHNYTTSIGENDHLVSLGWRPEGIGWYGV